MNIAEMTGRRPIKRNARVTRKRILNNAGRLLDFNNSDDCFAIIQCDVTNDATHTRSHVLKMLTTSLN